jgi:hypothetical protein
MLSKEFGEITAADIAELRERGAYESQLLEFKRELSGDSDDSKGWNTSGKISPTALSPTPPRSSPRYARRRHQTLGPCH